MKMIKATRIEKSFGNLHVLKGVDLTIEKSEIVSIVGASGAGKTTLLQILGIYLGCVITAGGLMEGGMKDGREEQGKREERKTKEKGKTIIGCSDEVCYEHEKKQECQVLIGSIIVPPVTSATYPLH